MGSASVNRVSHERTQVRHLADRHRLSDIRWRPGCRAGVRTRGDQRRCASSCLGARRTARRRGPGVEARVHRALPGPRPATVEEHRHPGQVQLLHVEERPGPAQAVHQRRRCELAVPPDVIRRLQLGPLHLRGTDQGAHLGRSPQRVLAEQQGRPPPGQRDRRHRELRSPGPCADMPGRARDPRQPQQLQRPQPRLLRPVRRPERVAPEVQARVQALLLEHRGRGTAHDPQHVPHVPRGLHPGDGHQVLRGRPGHGDARRSARHTAQPGPHQHHAQQRQAPLGLRGPVGEGVEEGHPAPAAPAAARRRRAPTTTTGARSSAQRRTTTSRTPTRR